MRNRLILGKDPSVRFHRRLELGFDVIRQIARGADRSQNIRVLRPQKTEEAVFKRPNLVERQFVEESVDAGVDDADLLLHLERRELRLLEQFRQTSAAVEQTLGDRVEIGAELRE